MEITLDALTDEPVLIHDEAAGTTWKADPELKTSEALWLKDVENLNGFQALERMTVIVSRCLRRHHPEMTADKVAETFSPLQVTRMVLAFLRLSSAMPSSTKAPTPRANGRVKPPSTPSSLPGSETP